MAMNEQQREILSAYFDGEATAEESTEAERLLRESADARAEWASLQSVAEQLRSLPRQTLPDEFRVAVLQSAERASLLPPAEVAHPEKRRASRVGWRPMAGTAVAVAVLLMIAVPYWGNRPEQHADETAAGRSENLQGRSVAEAHAPAEPEDAVAAPVARFKSAAEVASAGDVAKMASGSDQPIALPAAAEAEPAPRIQTDAGHLVFDTKSLTQVEIGDIVEALDGSGDDVSVVHLTVVDREQGLSALRLILRECRIEEDQAGPLVQNERDAAEPGMMAVYVESPRELLTAALQHLNRAPFEEVAVAEPIQVAELDPQAQAQLGVTARGDGLGTRAGFADAAQKQQGASSAAAPSAADSAESDSAQRFSDGKPPKTNAPLNQQRPGLGRQRSLLLPSIALTEARGTRTLHKDRTSIPPPALPEVAGHQPQSREADTFRIAEAKEPTATSVSSNDANRPMQVIFVLMSRRPTRPGGGAPEIPINQPGSVPPRNPGSA